MAKTKEEKQSKRDMLMNYLDSIGVKRLVVHYSGSGDSGQTDDYTVEPKNRSELLDEMFEEKSTLKEALDDFTWSEIENHEGGFYNNDGGYGEIIFDVKEKTITMAHNNYITETVYEEYDL